MIKFFLSVLVVVCLCSSQQKIVIKDPTLTLCWEGESDTAAEYLMYYRDYGAVDTTWNFIGKTKSTNYVVYKSNKKSVVFGVQTILYDDTSDIHSSLDLTACSSGETCDSTCSTAGSWYLRWKLRSPSRITAVRE